MIKLYHGDCLEIMKNIQDKSIDYILTDMPYNMTPCEWDLPINLDQLILEVERILKPNGVMSLFGTEPFSTKLRSKYKNIYKYDWYWKKCKSLGANFCHAKNSPIKTIETISCFSYAKINHINKTKNRMNYNPQGLIDSNISVGKRKASKISSFKKYLDRPSHINYIRKKTNYPDQILDIGFEKNERKNRYHPTQKPIKLLEYLIKTYTQQNDIILDFTMGSGSTGIACINTNRKFIGIELNKEYYEIAETRIRNHKPKES